MSSQRAGAIAVVMGRAGSKGVPGKNTLSIAGKPCAQWTIESAQQATGVERVLVSSDCPRLLALAETMGAEPAPRRPEDATDNARVDVALLHALDDWATGIQDADPVVLLYANVPVRPDGLIDRAVELLVRTGCDSVQSYARVGKHHPWWQARLGGEGRVTPWEGDVLNHGVYRRQDLPASYVPDGGVLALTRRTLAHPANDGPHGFLGNDHRGIETAEGEVVDIDSPVDLLVAEAKLKSFTTENTESTERRTGRVGTKDLPSKELTGEIIGAAIEVHRALGPGLLESAYEICLCEELTSRGLRFTRQVAVPVQYQSACLEMAYRLDLLVEDSVVLELKSVAKLEPIHEAQLLTYLRLSGKRLGLLLNFNSKVLTDGIIRRAL